MNSEKLNNTPLNNKQVIEAIKKQKILVMNENKNVICQNLGDTIKEGLRRKFIALNTYRGRG